jgi:hypothetical protein
MKKLFTLLCTLVLGATLSFAQAGGGSTGSTGQEPTKPDTTTKPDTDKKGHKGGKKGHKGGKKHKKGDKGGETTPPPK